MKDRSEIHCLLYHKCIVLDKFWRLIYNNNLNIYSPILNQRWYEQTSEQWEKKKCTFDDSINDGSCDELLLEFLIKDQV